jgi:SAM-dependent methyltransferase
LYHLVNDIKIDFSSVFICIINTMKAVEAVKALESNIISHLSVKEVYNAIANHFNNSRQRVWGSVRKFIDGLVSGSSLLEVGCGNGKNMLYRCDLQRVGTDISERQVAICQKKGLNVMLGCMTKLEFDDCCFDNIICIATYHHLDNDKDRGLALREMYRCLKVDGQLLLTVWAMEQGEDSTFHFTQTDSMVPWKSKDDGNTYMRYYHIYRTGDLLSEIKRLCPEWVCSGSGWELGNWYVILTK